MSKRYDIYIKDGTAHIYPRGEVDECGDLPGREPLKVMREDEDWFDWCIEDCGGNATDDAIRVCRLVLPVNAEYAKDLQKRAQGLMDRYIREGKEHGWGDLAIDRSGTTYTFRASANWKEDPILYTFDQRLSWSNPADIDLGKQEQLWTRDVLVKIMTRDVLVKLIGMADAAHELGLDIVFDKDFKIHVMGANATWATKYEY